MKAAILTLALAIFMLGASATYVKATGGFTCSGTASLDMPQLQSARWSGAQETHSRVPP